LASSGGSEPWGAALLVSDGEHEEGVTFFPHQIMLAAAGLTAPFTAADQFHTYRVQFKKSEIQVWADDKLVLDGQGKFTRPAHARRNQLGFGCGSSNATGEAIWQWVRFQGGQIDAPLVTLPHVPGLDIQLGATQVSVHGRLRPERRAGELLRSGPAGAARWRDPVLHADWRERRQVHAALFEPLGRRREDLVYPATDRRPRSVAERLPNA
jgi:hypothetical protein